ncbi:MAG: DinB family protein [Dehalococcoidia bacterium]
MNSEVDNYVGLIGELLDKIERHVGELSREALNWRPLERGTNSVAAIAAHMCGVANYWMIQAMTGKDVGRDRDSEFRVEVDERGYISFWGEQTTLLSLLARTRSDVADTLSRLPSAALDDVIKMPDGESSTKRWVVLHTIDELAQHLGHVEVTIQLWAAEHR